MIQYQTNVTMEYNKENPLRVFEAFGGYGSQSLALQRLKRDFPDFDFKVVGYSDIEDAAISAYMALHQGEGVENFGDISKIDWLQVPDFDLFTYSFPCQDISNAGLQRGFEKGSGSRSSLLWECERAIEAKKPRFLLMENVKALTQKKFLPDFGQWLALLESYGYKTWWQVLNAEDYGVPQHRERVFAVSILDDGNCSYVFPHPFPLELCLADVLEDNVDEKYFLRDEMLVRFCEKSLERDVLEPQEVPIENVLMGV